MALPSNDKVVGDFGHTSDHNLIVSDIQDIRDTFLGASVAAFTYLRQDTASVNWENVNNKPDPIIGVNLTGNTTAAASVTLTNLTNGQISLTTNTNFATSASSINWIGVTNKPDPIIGINLTGNTTGAASATLTDLTNGQISITTNTTFATSASSMNWSGVTGRPTTLSGYGITDAIPVSASQAYLTRSDAGIIYAPLASASLTGTPIAPTAASGTNTQQIATTAFVRTEVSNLIASAPATLDTLNELAAALGNDSNFATSTASAIGQRLLASTASTLYMSIGSTANHATSASSINWNGVTNRPDPIIGVSLSGNTSGAASVTLTGLTNGQISITTNTAHAGTASSIAGSLVTGTVGNATNATHSNTASSINSSLITGTTLPAAIINSSLTSVGTLTNLSVTNVISGRSASANFSVHSLTASSISGTLVTGAVNNSVHSNTASSIAGSLVSGVVSNALHSNTASSINWSLITSRPSLVTSVTGGNGITVGGTATDPTVSLNAGASVSWGNVSSKPSPIIGVNLTGDVTGAASATLTDLTNGQITINTTVAANSVALGIDTTGDYVSGVTGGTGITITGTTGEGWSPVINIDATASVTWANVSSKPSPVIGINLTGNTTGAASATLTQLTNGQISIVTKTSHADTASFVHLSNITGLGSNVSTFLTTPTSANLAAAVTDETGTGRLVFSNSASFDGVPTAPTAASATNNTQIATTAFVRTAVSNLVSSAPATLDTLNELAAALGNDANFATTITNSLSTKLDSGTASATYLTKTDASNTYFPRSASGGLLTEEEAAATYLPISASSTLSPIGYLTEASASAIYLNKVDASNTYLPISASTNYLFNSTASATYLRIDSASSLYLPISASSNYLFSSTASATYLRRDTASSLYLPISASSNYLFNSTASATYLRQDSASVIYASLISPAFSGIPTAPTAASSSNSTQIATTEFVKSAISNIIDFAPETLDTLNELAAAIADDPNFSTTITNSLSSKLDSATASSVYLSISSASATYIGKDDIIDCGGP